MIKKNKLKALTILTVYPIAYPIVYPIAYPIVYPIAYLVAYIIIASSLSLTLNNYAFANSQIEQYLRVNNNATVLARSSLREITRIAFNHEVTDINAIAGELEYAVNGKDLYLRTIAEKPVNFFVKLEGGWTFKIILSAEDIPANQIFVNIGTSSISVPTDNDNQLVSLSKISEQVSPLLKKRIEKIISVSLRPTKHIGYEIIAQNKSLTYQNKNHNRGKNKDLNQGRDQSRGRNQDPGLDQDQDKDKGQSQNQDPGLGLSQNQDLAMKLVGTINGDMLKAEKIYLTNKSNDTKSLALEDFIAKGNLAVYLTKALLLPNEQAVLIRISEK